MLVTGHTGFKGAWCCTRLLQLGARVTGLALDPVPDGAYTALGLDEEIDDLRVDVRDRTAVERAVARARPEVVLHLAGQPIVGRGFVDPTATFATNVQGTLHVLDACRAAGSVRAVVAVTSDKVYVQDHDGALDEDAPLGHHDPYSASKAAAELAVASWSRSHGDRGPAVATARAGNVLGGGDRGHGRLLPEVLDHLAATGVARLRDPEGVRPWQHVTDVAEGYLRLAAGLLTRPAEMPPAVNIGPGPEGHRRVREVVEHAIAAWGSGRWERQRTPLEEAGVLRLDASLAARALGWRPRLSVAEAVAWTVAWQRAWQAGADVRALTRQQLRDHADRVTSAADPAPDAARPATFATAAPIGSVEA